CIQSSKDSLGNIETGHNSICLSLPSSCAPGLLVNDGIGCGITGAQIFFKGPIDEFINQRVIRSYRYDGLFHMLSSFVLGMNDSPDPTGHWENRHAYVHRASPGAAVPIVQ